MKNVCSFLLYILLSCALTSAYANSTITVQTKEGAIKFKEFLAAAPEIADSTVSKRVNPDLGGKVILIGDKKYEIRFFSFEDTIGALPVGMTFKQYIEKNSLLNSNSTFLELLPGVEFESFDFRKFKLNDGVYFSMAVRAL